MSKRYDSSLWIMARDFDIDLMSTQLTAVLDSATSDDIQNGLTWYQRARQFCVKTAEQYQQPLKLVTAVTSALSPRNSWEQNKTDVKNLFEYGDNFVTSTYDQNRSKALKFYHGKLEPDIAYNPVKNWSKTACFYHNILEPDGRQLVTIDSHAARICHGYYLTSDDSILYVNTPAKYKRTAQVYIDTANSRQIIPSQCQAIAWIVYRRLFVKNSKNEQPDIKPIIL
jgi:hypothetical protein